MLVGDSRRMGGPGVLPLRHINFEKDGFDLAMRASVLGVRIQEWRMIPGETNAYIYGGVKDLGDLNGALFWPADTREMPMVSWVYPAILSSGGAGGLKAIPAKKGWKKDVRFKELDVTLAPEIEEFGGSVPVGSPGLVVAATNEEEEYPLFFSQVGAPIIAVHHDGDPKKGTTVYDLNKHDQIDRARGAKLQSLTRVIKNPLGRSANELAWNIGTTGKSDTEGGLVTDDPIMPKINIPIPVFVMPSTGGAGGVGGSIVIPNPPTPPPPVKPTIIGQVWGEASTRHGGPFDMGQPGDKHKLGVDADGHEINPVHFNTDTLFRRNQNDDGPLLFEKVVNGGGWPYTSKVHLGFGGTFWEWWTTVPLYVPGGGNGGDIQDAPVFGGNMNPGGGGHEDLKLDIVVNPPIGGNDPGGGPPVVPRPPAKGGGEDPYREFPMMLRGPGVNETSPDPASGRDVSPRCAPADLAPDLRNLLARDTSGQIDTTPESLAGNLHTIANLPDTELVEPLVSSAPSPLIPTTEPESSTVLDPEAQRAPTSPDIGLVGLTSKIVSEALNLPTTEGLPAIQDQQQMMESPQTFRNYGPWTPGTGARRYQATNIESATPALLSRPAQPAPGKPDLRNETHPDLRQVAYKDKTTPVTGRMESYGQRQGESFVYTHRPGEGRYMGGTGDGGWMISPPEIGIEDAPFYMRNDIETSTTRMTYAPGAKLSFGMPDLHGGGLGVGWDIDFNDGQLRFAPVVPFNTLQFEGIFTPGPVVNAHSNDLPIEVNGVYYNIHLYDP